MLAVVTYKYSNLNLGLGSDRTGILIAWSEYHSKMVSVSEALRKWDELAPSVLDIYYVFILCNNIDWCMNVRNWNKLLQNKINKKYTT